MKKLRKRLKALRLPSSLLALVLASSMLFNVCAVTVQQPSNAEKAQASAEQTEAKASNDEAGQKNNSALAPSSEKEDLEPVGAEAGTRYKMTFTVGYDDTAKDAEYAQSITFPGVTYDSETSDTPATDYTVQIPAGGANIIRWVDKAEATHNYNLKSNSKVKVTNFNAYVYSGTNKVSRLDSKYITNYSSSYFAILAHTPAANIEYKNTELKDVYFELTYSSNANSEYYSATVIATGYVGPYTVGTAPKADSAVNHYLRIEGVSSSDRIYETDTGSGAYSYKEWSISNNASKTYYMKKTSGDIKYRLDGTALARLDSVKAYYNEDETKTNILTQDQMDSILNDANLNSNVQVLQFANDAKKDITFEVNFVRAYKEVTLGFDMLNTCSNTYSYHYPNFKTENGSFIYNGGGITASDWFYTGRTIAFRKELDSFTATFNSGWDFDLDTVKLLDSSGAEVSGVEITATTRTAANQNRVLTVTGLPDSIGKYTLTGNFAHVHSDIRLVALNAHPGNLTVTGSGAFDYPKSATLGNGSAVSNLSAIRGSSLTATYADATYGTTLTSAKFIYVDTEGNTHTEDLAVADNSFSFTVPNIYDANNSKNTDDIYPSRIELTFDQPFVAAPVKFDAQYKGSIKLTDTENTSATGTVAEVRSSTGGVSVSTTNTKTFNDTNNDIQLKPGVTYKLENLYNAYRPYTRLEFLGFEVLDENNQQVAGDENEGNKSFTFVMPDGPITIRPKYKDHMRTVNVVVNDTTRGSAALAGADEAKLFYQYYLTYYSNATSFTGKEDWSTSYCGTLDNYDLSLTGTVVSDSYSIKSVKVYSAASPSPRAGSTTNLKITKDAEGNITNNEVTSGYTLSAPQTTDLSSLYTLKFTDPKTEDGTEVYNLIVYIEFDSDDTKYAPFTFTCDKLSTQGYAPPVYFNGEFKDKDPGAKINGVYTDYHYVPICGSEEGLTIRKNTDVVMHVYGNDYITIEKCNSRNVYTNLLFTVTDDNGDNQASFRYYNGRVYDKQGNYDDYVKNLAVTYGNASGNYSENKINQHVAFTLTVPEDGLKINMKVVDTYVPVVVNQYVISDDGTRRLATADDGFTAAITKKSNSSGTDAYKYKFFTQSYAEDYYSKLADNTAFCDSFTVTGGTEKHNMLMESNNTGGYVSASPVEGYMVASIDARTTNCDGVEQTDFNGNYYNSAYAYKAGTDYSNKLITANFFGNVQRSQQLVINIYYAKKTTVTFKQVVADSQVNTSSGTELAWAELSNPNTLDDGLTAFIETDESGMFNSGNPLRQLDGMTGYYSRAMIIRGSNKTSADTSVDPYEYTWLSKYYTNRGTGFDFTATPKASYIIGEAKAYKVLPDGTQQPLTVTLVSGTGANNTTTKYHVEEAAAYGDNIVIEIDYVLQQVLKVEVRMLNDENDLAYTAPDGVTVSVTGTRNGDTNVFWNDDESNKFASFTVDQNDYHQSVQNGNRYETSETASIHHNTAVTVSTDVGSSPYRIANVVAYNMNNNGREDTNSSKLFVVPGKQITTGTDNEKRDWISYDTCSINGFNKSKSAIIIVYLAKTSTIDFTVWTANDAGEYSKGINAGEGSYAVINTKNNLVGYDNYAMAMVTNLNEGNFNTDHNRFTSDGNETRNDTILQGTTLDAWAQVPLDSNYVIKKIVCKYTADNGAVVKITANTSDGVRFNDGMLSVNFKTTNRILPGCAYTVDVYIAPARTIYTRATLEKDSTVTSAVDAGDVTVIGSDNPDPEVSAYFTKIRPANDDISTSYDAVYYSSTYDYTSSARCANGTKLAVKVKPKSGYMISDVSAHLGSANGTKLRLSASDPDSNGAITYTLLRTDGQRFEMPTQNDVYISVKFSIKNSGIAKIKVQYTDDLSTVKTIPGNLENAVVTVSASNTNNIFTGEYTLTDLATSEKSNGFTVPAYTGETYDYQVLAGSSFTVSATGYKGYIPLYAKITKGGSTSNANVSQNTGYFSTSATVNADEEVTIEVLLVPVGRFSLMTTNLNCYNNSPAGVQTSDRNIIDFITFNASNDSEMIDKPIYADNRWKSTDDGLEATNYIVQNSDLTITADTSKIDPGNLLKVEIYKNGVKMDDSLIIKGGTSYMPTFTIPAEQIGRNDVFYVHPVYECIDIYNDSNHPINAYMVCTSQEDIDKVAQDTIRMTKSYVYVNDEHAIYLRTRSHGTQGRAAHLSQSYATRVEKNYFVIEKIESDDEVRLTGATFYDYKVQQTVSILGELKAHYSQYNVDGYTHYFYVYEVDPDNLPTLDNSMHFKLTFTKITNPSTPNPEDPSNPDEALVTLTQFARANNNAYQSTTDGTATMRVADGTSFMLSGDETAASLTVPNEPETGVSELSVTGRTYIGKKVKVSVQAPENYYVSKVEAVSSGGANTVSSDSNGDYIVNINSGIVNINVYYAMPQITFSTNNTAQTGKGTVFIDGEEIISEHEYMDKALVKQGETKTLLIRPNKYTDSHGEEKNYSVAYILMGTSRNNMKLIDSNAISTNETTGEITVTLENISSDYDLHIQFAGEEEIKTAMLIVSHHIKLTGEYQDCDADNHGTVVTTGTLSGVDKPLRDSTEAEVENLTLTEDASISGFAVKGTQLSFAVTPPEEFGIENVTARFASTTESTNDEELSVTGENGSYQLSSLAPDSGVVYVDVYYAIPTYTVTYDGNGNTSGEAPVDSTPYPDKAAVTVLGKNTLAKTDCTFLGWSTDQNATEAMYTENETFTIDAADVTLYAVWQENVQQQWKLSYQYKDRFDEDKQYVVNVTFDQNEVNADGIPTSAALKANAPYITDMFKDCVWNVDSPEIDAENFTAVISATQTPPKHYIYFNNSDIATGERIEESELDDISDYQAERYYNELFTIEAPATDNSGSKFLYWKATDVVDGEKVEGTEKAVCYTAYYSYRVTKDLFIEPVYEDGENNWDITLSNAIYSREQFTDSEGANKQDNVYSDLLISVLTPDQSLIKDKDVQFGIVLEKADDGNYPGKNTEAIEMLFADILPESGKVTSAVRNDNTYYIYDKTDLAASMTNMNRIDYYIRFANTERLRGYKFNAYAYLIVDGTVIVSRDVSELCIDECGTRVYE